LFAAYARCRLRHLRHEPPADIAHAAIILLTYYFRYAGAAVADMCCMSRCRGRDTFITRFRHFRLRYFADVYALMPFAADEFDEMITPMMMITYAYAADFRRAYVTPDAPLLLSLLPQMPPYFHADADGLLMFTLPPLRHEMLPFTLSFFAATFMPLHIAY